ncbi:2Fe-2S iron-sulfur cluster-binding protein [Streptomyces sp. NPDC058657]|uniref:(2Fe-2S)-binding protein n=1 Tax=unclassified Streptomyces TaxID=2593676 RepID=UPI003650A654
MTDHTHGNNDGTTDETGTAAHTAHPGNTDDAGRTGAPGTGHGPAHGPAGTPQDQSVPASLLGDGGHHTAFPGQGGTGHAPHVPGPGLGPAGWQPTPQGGEYDADATAFVQLPAGFDLPGTGDPLAAPGHDYVPPHITAPLETGTWNVHLHQDPQPFPPPPYLPHDTLGSQQHLGQHLGQQFGQQLGQESGQGQGAQYHDAHPDPQHHDPQDPQRHDPQAHRQPPVSHDPHAHQPSAGWPVAGHDAGTTSQWNFTDAFGQAPQAPPAPPAAAPDAAAPDATAGMPTGQWTFPAAQDESPDDSGEFPVPPAAPWHSPGAPATLPGGAPAPWALQPHQPARPAEGAEPAEPVRAEPGVPAQRGLPVDVPPAPPTGTPADGTHFAAHHAPEGTAAPGESAVPGEGGADAGTVPTDADDPAAGTLPADASAPAAGNAPADTAAPAERTPDGDLPPGTAPAQGAEATAPPASRPDAEPPTVADATSDPAPDPSALPAADPDTAEGAAPAPNGADAPATDPDGTPAPDGPPDAAPEHTPAQDHAPGPGHTPDPGRAPDPDPGHVPTPAHPLDPGHAPETPIDVEPAYAAPHEPAPFHDAPSEHPLASYVLRVNGADRPVADAWIGESLLYVLRERLGLAGAKDGCSQGECGACAVQVDGRLVASCLVPAATTAGSEVRTVEGLATDGEPSDVQRALANCGAVQCGFCIPGMAMTVHDLLEGNHAPTDLETRQALCGNLCRCSGYRGVLQAVREVVTEREASAEAAATGHPADEARIPHQAPPGAGSAQHTLHHPHDGGMP